LIGAVALAAPAIPPARAHAAAGKAKAWVQKGDRRVDFAHTCGLLVFDSSNQPEPMIFLANHSLDCGQAETAIEPESDLDRQADAAGASTARLLLHTDGTNASLVFTLREPFDSYFVSGSTNDLTVSTRTANRVAGRWRASKPDSAVGEPVSYDVQFAEDLRSGAVTGESLPAGGAAPGAAYQEYLRALARKDFPALQRLTVSRMASRALGLGAGTVFEAFRSEQPRTAEIAGGLLQGADGNRATLFIKAKTWGGESISRRVRMQRDSAESPWRLANEGLTVVAATP
jgi:hypothetical protein